MRWCHWRSPAAPTPSSAEPPPRWRSGRAFRWRAPPEQSGVLNLRGERSWWRRLTFQKHSWFEGYIIKLSLYFIWFFCSDPPFPSDRSLLILIFQPFQFWRTCVSVDAIIGFHDDEARVSSSGSVRHVGGGAAGDSSRQGDGQSGGVIAPGLPLMTHNPTVTSELHLRDGGCVGFVGRTFLWKTSPNSRRCCKNVSRDSLMPSTE